MNDAPEILLTHHLKALKLPTFLREHQKLARQCAAEGMDHEPERADEIMRDALEAVRQLGRDCLSRPAGRPS